MTTSRSITLVLALVWALCVASLAHGSVASCQKSIAKETQKFLALKSKALQKCEDKRTSGSLPPSTTCRTDSATAIGIAKASAKARNGIAKSCCGHDRACGNADDESLASLGWGSTSQCPNFENGQTGSCTNAIDDPGDVADC